MADPIPLVHNGITRAWMCGVCHRVHAHDSSDECRRRLDEVIPATQWSEETTVGKLIAYRVDRFDRDSAERCCRCRDCGCDLAIPRDSLAWTCERCAYLDQWIHTIRRIANAIATASIAKKPARVPVVPLPPDDAWEQGGDGGQGHVTWPIVAGMSELSEDAYCATWMSGCEYAIWDLGTSAARDGYGNLDGSEARERAEVLVAASDEYDVWWYYRSPLDSADVNDPIRSDPNDYRGPWPVTLATWSRMLWAHDFVRKAVRRG